MVFFHKFTKFIFFYKFTYLLQITNLLKSQFIIRYNIQFIFKNSGLFVLVNCYIFPETCLTFALRCACSDGCLHCSYAFCGLVPRHLNSLTQALNVLAWDWVLLTSPDSGFWQWFFHLPYALTPHLCSDVLLFFCLEYCDIFS